jgi:hypothetical protein
MDRDLYSRRGLFSVFDPYNRRSLERMATLTRCFTWAFIGILVYFVSGMVIGLFTAAEVVDFVPCLPGSEPDAELIRRVRSLQTIDTPVACSTRDQVTRQPCVCCVQEDCWRGVEIKHNGTQWRTMEDVVGQRFLRRRLPRTMNVCYKALDGHETCRVEEKTKVGDVLRAIELLRGWAPSGEEVPPTPGPS